MAVSDDSVSRVGSLPSELFSKYCNSTKESSSEKKEDSKLDAESLLQNGLSALAAQQDLVEILNREANDDMPNWIWQTLTSTDDKDFETENKDSAKFEWVAGTRLIRSVLIKLTPFEIHSVASQSIVFTDGSKSHLTLCLLLCVYSLQKCPTPILQRWKRWQSLLCETVRIFQKYGVEVGDLSVPIWTRHVVPACQHVIRQLPSEAHHVAFLAGLVGTTSTLVVGECQHTEEGESLDRRLSNVRQLLDVVRTIVDMPYGYSDTWVWLNAWRVYSFKRANDKDFCDEVEYLKNQEDIVWWTQRANRHESVAGMDTAWNDLGISLLACMAFETRPLVFTPNYTWKVWFPHVSVLFKTTSDNPFLDHLPLSLLDNLFQVVPRHSLPAVSSTSKKPDSPFSTFQLLSNRIMVKPVGGKKKQSSKKKELESKARSERILGFMKSLLERYHPVNQVKIVRKLVHDCPHPGLQAKFMDLLRPVIFEEEASEALWSYISSFMKDLLAHVDSKTDTLVRTDDLVQKVELYVGAITMIQLWCMVKGKLPKRIHGSPLGKFYKILKNMLESWVRDDRAMPPDDYYRLYLLEGALQQVVRHLVTARRKGSSTDGSSSSLSIVEETLPSEDSDKSEKAPVTAVVGDLDIFA